MKTVPCEIATAGIWGLHITSFFVASIPYLQATSLLLAIAVSIITLGKLLQDKNKKK